MSHDCSKKPIGPVRVQDGRTPIQMTPITPCPKAALQPNAAERGRSPVEMTPAQPKNSAPAVVKPAPPPPKKG